MPRNKLDPAHILSLTNGKDYGLCTPPMDAKVAINELRRYFLGDDWYTVLPQSSEQIITEIVYEIEKNYRGYNNKRKRKSKK
jgi:hypothetical protein